MTDNFFLNRLDQFIDLGHPLAVLASRLSWQEIEGSLAHRWARQVKAGKKVQELDLFGPTVGLWVAAPPKRAVHAYPRGSWWRCCTSRMR